MLREALGGLLCVGFVRELGTWDLGAVLGKQWR